MTSLDIIHVVDLVTLQSVRCHIGCSEMRELFIDFITQQGFGVAIKQEKTMPERPQIEVELAGILMGEFKHYLDARVLH